MENMLQHRELHRKMKPMEFKISVVVLLAAGAIACSQLPFTSASSGNNPPLTTVAALDVPRYMGSWYEIAKYPNKFQKKCAAETRAEYKPMPGGTVQVTNRCKKADGSIDEAVGEARQLGDATSPKLQVRFAPAWLALIPWVWGNYWVIDLDPAYQLAAVSEPSREYLWVLSRTPTVSKEAYDALLARLKAQGFELERLERTLQAP
jgi:apolipoprotein D and lipocalin family protein